MSRILPETAKTAQRSEADASRLVLRNTGYLTFNSGMTIALGLVTTVILARGLGPALMGIYATLTAATGVLTIAVDFGTDMLVTRQVAREQSGLLRIMKTAGRFKLFFTFWPAVLILLLLPWIYGYDRAEVRLAFFLGITVVALEGSWSVFASTLKGLERMGSVARINITAVAFQAVVVIAVLFADWPLAAAVAALITAGMVRAAGGWIYCRRAWRSIRPMDPAHPSMKEVRALAPVARVFFFTAVVFALNDRLDIFLVSYICGAEETGFYGVAARFAITLSIIPGAMVAALYPYLSRRPDRDQTTFRRLRLTGFVYGVMAAITVILLGKPIIKLVLGPEFLPAYQPLSVRIWVLPFFIAANFLAIRLYSRGFEKPVAWRVAIGLGFNLVLNLIFIPRWGGVGAATATVISELLVFVLLVALSRQALSRGNGPSSLPTDAP